MEASQSPPGNQEEARSKRGPLKKTPPLLTFKKNKRGSALKSSEKQIILNVYSRLCEENPNERKCDIEARTGELTGVSSRTVNRIRMEFKRGSLSTLGKHRPHLKGRKLRMERMLASHKVAIRRLIHSFFRKKAPPTLNMIKAAMDADDDLPQVSGQTVHRILHDLGFEYKNRGRKAFLVERYDIQIWRVNYLRDITKFREENRPIYFVDETWFNYGHTCNNKVWNGAKGNDPATGLSSDSGSQDGRFVVVHIGSQEGFVDGGLFYVRSNEKGDYHKDMDAMVFESWFYKILQLLPNNSVIVMDSAPYHSAKVPTMSWRKQAIVDWLDRQAIAYPETALKIELISIVKDNKHKFSGYIVDAAASEGGHTVLRLPPHHCDLNPMEMVWGQVKRHVAAKNTTSEASEVERLIIQGVLLVTPENWLSYCSRVMKLEEEWQTAHRVYEQHQEALIEVNGSDGSAASDDGSSSSSSDTDEEQTFDISGLPALSENELCVQPSQELELE